MMSNKDTLQTERLFLRPIEIGDEELLWPHVTDPRISQYMSWAPHKEREETVVLVERLVHAREAGTGITWIIFEQDCFRGIFSLIDIKRRHRVLTYHRAEPAYWIVPEYWGKGITTEAGFMVIDHAFGPLELNRLVVEHDQRNVGSQKLIERWGFCRVGEFHQAFMKNGVWIDTVFYELLKENF